MTRWQLAINWYAEHGIAVISNCNGQVSTTKEPKTLEIGSEFIYKSPKNSRKLLPGPFNKIPPNLPTFWINFSGIQSVRPKIAVTTSVTNQRKWTTTTWSKSKNRHLLFSKWLQKLRTQFDPLKRRENSVTKLTVTVMAKFLPEINDIFVALIFTIDNPKRRKSHSGQVNSAGANSAWPCVSSPQPKVLVKVSFGAKQEQCCTVASTYQ